MSGSANNLPVRITVDGVPQAEAAFNSVAATGERAMQRISQGANQSQASTRGFNDVVQQGGFQLQDFAVQVQGGTSALTALSQQGSQFLGIFGPAGAVAGAVLTVGLLAAKFLELGTATETATEAEKKLQDAITASSEIYEDATAKADRLARARLSAAQAGIEERITAERDSLRALNSAAADMEDRRAFATGRVGGGGTNDNPVVRAERERIAQQAEQISARIAALELERTRLAAIGSGNGEQFGPPAPSGRDSGASRATARVPAAGLDVRAAVARTVDEATAAYDRYNQVLNLNQAGLSGAASALSAYEASMTTLNNALAAGVITEQQFAADVESSTTALAVQMEAIEQRTQQADRSAVQFGLVFSSALEGAITRGEDASQVLQALGEDLAKLILRFTIMEPLARSVAGLFSGGGGGGGGGGILSTIASVATTWITGGVAGTRANGGPVMGGSSYLVGERGPEIVNFAASGVVTPNHAIGGPTFAPTYQIDARGADASVAPMLEAKMRAIAAQSLAQFTDSIRRGGPGAKLVGAR
ncbi:hypothetical protein [Falsiroseomonas tokyonensis]|uniref:Bacteriophage tail tape measure N-terminal domain-containing protein n=1 Tax=Falsiroseomonas tokyonensis TaxID=430521 RepID=A0ABV7BZZ1_9PROT|nr:hypothetical protein [Falsiroseomonas tokyonensis]MBU8539493.1 hypothetical protein [Falsiroseomonas tokyonensis]